jgi:hypothetical protein
LPDALSGRVRSLDYKTLRFSGHYGWIQKQLIELKDQQTKLALQQKCKPIPQIEEDQIVLYAAVEGKDIEGFCEDGSFHIPQKWKPSIKSYTNHYSRALSAGSPLLLEQSYKGVLLQSQINSEKFSTKLYRTRVRQNKTN